MADNQNYRRVSISLPVQGWDNLVSLAQRTNSRARTGSRHGQASMRSLLHHFAMEDAPRIIEQMDAQDIQLTGWQTVHFTIDMSKLE